MTDAKIQILSLRTFTNEDGREILHDRRHFKNMWRADSVKEIFDDFPKFIGAIPEHERWNIYYTACRCTEEKGRKFVDQDIIPIDIDNIDRTQIKKYIGLLGDVLQLDMTKVGIIDSGNGLQFIILLNRKIENVNYFDVNRAYYKALCGAINSRIFEEGLIGDADPSVFSGSRLLRMPFTENRKEKGNTTAEVINANIEAIDFNLVKVSGLPELLEADHINTRAFARLPKPDTQGVLEGCSFLQHCHDEQDKMSEPEWYAMLSIIGRLEDGSKLVHKYSEKHTGYNPDDTDRKMTQALEASGPRTCANISTMYDGCASCPHFRSIKSPIQIRGESFISTKDTGFWNVVINKDGQVKRVAPNYDDLVKFYDVQHKHVVIRETELVYHWSGKHWKMREKIDMNAFIEAHMEPAPTVSHCNEFVGKMKRTNVQATSWLTVQGKINLSNGVLDVATGEFLQHDDVYGFPYVLPFDYTPNVECPLWEKFIEEVTLDREEVRNVLQEFMGLCLGFIDPTLVQRSAILLGEGANGKSVYLNVLKRMLGEENYSVVPLQEAASNRTARVSLVAKMANITEETPRGAFIESSFFKDLVSGGEVEAHKMYHGPFKFKNTAKVIMACNELPSLEDISNGMRRRLLVIPFSRIFARSEQDPLLSMKLEAESSGIFNWALTGLRRLNSNGWQFSDGTIIGDFFNTQLEDDNPMTDWIFENIEVDKTYEGDRVANLYDEYCLSVTRGTPITKKKFTKVLKLHACRMRGVPNIDTTVKRVDGCTFRLLPTIKFKGMNNAEY